MFQKLCRELLYSRINGNGGTTHGLIIEGYPRTEAQLADIQAVLGRLDLAILVDCTEQFCIDNIAKKFQGNQSMVEDSPEVVKTRMALFKQNTLPMLKSLDEKGILRVVEPLFCGVQGCTHVSIKRLRIKSLNVARTFGIHITEG
ncbi:unnamed protein product [Cylicostephanus goldi]|uniref:Adenylate kinase active site lid domain-containing protein n=1 Tax=Cylicostephanus goldi TaxID=71465 RepID=A0A3P6RU57_CYLGO|nr:unnamed protein product [Cylicostephanus goldi]